MLPTTSRCRLLCVVAVAAIAPVTGCSTETSGDDPAQPTQTMPDVEPTTAPVTDDPVHTSAAPTLSAQEQDEADITATLEGYTAALDAARVGDESIEGIYPYSSGAAREQWITQLMAYEAQGLTLTGDTRLLNVEATVQDDSADVLACVDVSRTDAVNEDGDSIVPPDRLDQTHIEYVLEREDWAAHGWAVVEHNNRDESCDG